MESDYFKNYVTEKIAESLNKDRKEFLGEFSLKNFEVRIISGI